MTVVCRYDASEYCSENVFDPSSLSTCIHGYSTDCDIVAPSAGSAEQGTEAPQISLQGSPVLRRKGSIGLNGPAVGPKNYRETYREMMELQSLQYLPLFSPSIARSSLLGRRHTPLSHATPPYITLRAPVDQEIKHQQVTTSSRLLPCRYYSSEPP